MKILVTIASHGVKNQAYLDRLIDEYRAMPYDVDLVVLSDVARDMGPDVEVVLGRPDRNPWSLPFGHKQILAQRAHDYDLFIYSEDDTLIERRHIEAFLEATAALPKNCLAGFLRYEEGPDGRRYCSTVHSCYHWVPDSVRVIGSDVFAYFTNEHAGAFILTQEQLQAAIASGGFLVGPHEGRYDLLCSASTDPYTQCGFVKMVCISRLDDFLLHHLSGRYVGRMGLPLDEMHRQIEALLRCANGNGMSTELFPTATKLNTVRWDKLYYEPARSDVLAAVPPDAKQVLSVGCESGATEGILADRGTRVVGIPLDTVVAESARLRNLELTPPDFKAAFQQLAGQRFDCVLLINILQHIPHPSSLLTACAGVMTDTGRLVIVVANFQFLRHRLDSRLEKRMWRPDATFEELQVHRTTLRHVRAWLAGSGLKVTQVRYDATSRFGWLVTMFGRLVGPQLSRSILITAEKA